MSQEQKEQKLRRTIADLATADFEVQFFQSVGVFSMMALAALTF